MTYVKQTSYIYQLTVRRIAAIAIEALPIAIT